MTENVVDQSRRTFLTRLTSIVGGVGAAFAAVPFISSWLPSARAQAAGAPVEVDLSNLQPGEMMTVEWRGRPIWVLRRTADMLEELAKPDHLGMLRDPDSKVVEQTPSFARNNDRSIKPEVLVVVGICTHLGCVPTFMPTPGSLNSSWPGGFMCPCHGSMFDLAGRVFKGVPAPTNLEVPQYTYLSNDVIIIGQEYAGPGPQQSTRKA